MLLIDKIVESAATIERYGLSVDDVISCEITSATPSGHPVLRVHLYDLGRLLEIAAMADATTVFTSNGDGNVYVVATRDNVCFVGYANKTNQSAAAAAIREKASMQCITQ